MFLLLRHLRHLLEKLNILHWRNKQRYTGQTMNILKGTNYQISVDERDTTFATLSTGVAKVNFNKIDYGNEFCALWLDGQITSSVDLAINEFQAIERVLREHLSPGYSIK